MSAEEIKRLRLRETLERELSARYTERAVVLESQANRCRIDASCALERAQAHAREALDLETKPDDSQGGP